MRFILQQAQQEIIDQLRGYLVPITFIGSIAFQVIMLTGAQNTQQLSVLGVTVNSAYWVYLWVSGQSLWINFIFAWVFSRTVLRDREAVLHEIVLSSQAPLVQLIIGRYLGAIGIAILLSMNVIIGFILLSAAPLMGLVPAEYIGPMPLAAMAWATLVITLPTIIGIGALSIFATLRTGSVAGAFGAAAILSVTWMLSVSVLNEGSFAPILASLMEPWAYAHLVRVTDDWTIQQKMSRLFSMDMLLIINRLLWLFAPLGLLAFALKKLKREDLLADRPKKTSAKSSRPMRALAPRPVLGAARSWATATVQEARWQAERLLKSLGFWAGFVFISFVGALSISIQYTQRPDGPLYTFVDSVGGYVNGTTLLFSYLFITAATGMIMRRDERRGFDDIVSVMPAPLGVLVAGKALAAFTVTGVITLSSVIVMSLLSVLSPTGLDFIYALNYGLTLLPANLQVCVLAIVIHTVINRTGTAYSVSILLILFAAMNYENGLLKHPLAQFSVPAAAVVSELLGWGPWFGYAIVGGAARIGVVGVLLALAWLLWRRGIGLPLKQRAGLAVRRLRTSAGLVGALSLAVTAGTAWVIQDRSVHRGTYTTPEKDAQEAARFETTFDSSKGAFSIARGAATVSLDTSKLTATSRIDITGLRAAEAILHGDLPHGARIINATINAAAARVTQAAGHFTIDAEACVSDACRLVLELDIDGGHWPWEVEPSWMSRNAVLFTAHDVLPSLGIDPERYIRIPALRKKYGLRQQRVTASPLAYAPVEAVMPGARWTWTVNVNEDGGSTPLSGAYDGPLDFAVFWRRDAEFQITKAHGIAAYHGARRAGVAKDILNDVAEMRRCVSENMGLTPNVSTVLQAQRLRGQTALYGDVLWIRENDAWDAYPNGPGGHLRRFDIARALTAHVLADAAHLRDENGARWLTMGAAGAVAMTCVAQVGGTEAWHTVLKLKGADITAQIGAATAPITRVSEALDDAWAETYAAYSSAVWAEGTGLERAFRQIRDSVNAIRAGQPAIAALEEAIGVEIARSLLGPPVATDIAISPAQQDGAIRFTTRRWNWRNGDWAQSPQQDPVLMRFDRLVDNTVVLDETTRLINVENKQAFALFPYIPSFEKTLEDNLWSPAPAVSQRFDSR